MTLARNLRVDDGLHIVGGGKSIDVVLRSITGSGPDKKANLEIKGISSLESIELSYAKPSVELVNGINLGLSKERKDFRLNRVRIRCAVPPEYSVSSITY